MMQDQAGGAGAGRGPQILVAGAGSTGIAAALAFARAGLRVALVAGFVPLPGRTVALFEASVRFLDALGALERVKAKACPIEAIRMIDDTGQLLPTPDLTLRASEIDLPALGINISNDELVEALLEVTRERRAFEIVDAESPIIFSTGKERWPSSPTDARSRRISSSPPMGGKAGRERSPE